MSSRPAEQVERVPTAAPSRLPRSLHPGAWWLWALALAVAAGRTTNPLLLGMIIAVAALVVAARRSSAPWAVGFRWYLLMGALVVALRVVFRMLTAGDGPTVLFTLPRFELPSFAAGISLLGPVSAEAILAGFYDGLRLATLIVCVGAANSLANPKRLLAAVPSALYEVGTVLVISVSVFPQLVESVQRVRRARSLRCSPSRGRHALRGIIIPVLADALDRSLLLAAAMDSRGYGRRTDIDQRARRVTSALLLAGLIGIGVGAYGLMDAHSPAYLGGPLMFAGIAVGAAGFAWSGRRVRRSRYRPDHWRAVDGLVAACGAVGSATFFVADVVELYPSANPLAWPTLPLLPVIGLLIAAAPAVLAPPPGGRP